MIRINLLGQIRPKAARRPVDTGAAMPVAFIGLGLVLGALVLGFFYYTWQNQLNKENAEIKRLTAQKTELEQIKQQVEAFEKQKIVLQQRVSTIEQLQRDRTGGQELLDMVANTVSRTENLWLTEMVRKGNTLSMEGSSASINSVANFITALKRSGYFQKVEIKETKQDEKNTAVQSFGFQISAEITPPTATQTRPANAPGTPAGAKAPAKERIRGRDGQSIQRHVRDHAGAGGCGSCGVAGSGGRLRAGFSDRARAGRGGRRRPEARQAQPGSSATAGLQAALWRIETTDGRAFQAIGHAEDHRARRKKRPTSLSGCCRERRARPTCRSGV